MPLFSLVLCFFLSISALCSAATPLAVDAYLGAGYRQDHFNWSVAGPHHEPNILSELTWKDLKIAQVEAIGIVETIGGIYARGKADYGWILSGHETDHDFNGHNRNDLFLSSHAKSDKGEVFDLSAGMGFSYSLFCFKVIPLSGYSKHEQHLHMHDLVNDFDAQTGFVGPIKGLNSHYRAKWQGPWVGCDFDCCLGCLHLFGSFEYHWAKYRGTGHWNMRKEFVKDFQQHADGHGQIYWLGLKYNLGCWGLSLIGTYQHWKTQSGKDFTFFEEGSLESPFNGANWESYSVIGALNFSF